jgi:glyoxylase-like metal-dependent hydrolase (beta-lactamase superfamily II)
MNTYALICQDTGQSVLLDPGDEPDKLEEMIAGSEPVAILLTHTHVDHVGALAEMRRRLQVPLMAHGGLHAEDFDADVDHQLKDGDTVEIGDHTLRAIYAPGHIGDQICFAIEGDHRVIVGDTIFDGGPGKTWSNAGFMTTIKTLREVVLPWPDETVCYPGHGPSFHLKDIRSEVEAFVAKDHGEFFGDATWDM